MQQKTWETVANRSVSPLGAEALALNPRGWYHGETENFVVHYRNFSDALQIAREIEFDLWYVAKTLGAGKEQYARKSHVYLFQDDNEWRDFVRKSGQPATWMHSFALGDELFLNVHGTGQGFESHTVAHEATHAVVARIYRSRWPIWLNEGFAEYMADATNAARRGFGPNANPRMFRSATLSVSELVSTSRYPAEEMEVARLYETGAKFVRYLFTRYPPELFPRFVARILDGSAATAALVEIYGDDFRDLAAFDKRFKETIR